MALPIFGASYYFGACSDLSLLYEAYNFSSQTVFEAFRLSLLAFVSQVPVYIRLVLEIHRWPRSLSSLVGASTPRYYFTVLKLDRNTTNNAMVL
jgi:hypothetical protein